MVSEEAMVSGLHIGPLFNAGNIGLPGVQVLGQLFLAEFPRLAQLLKGHVLHELAGSGWQTGYCHAFAAEVIALKPTPPPAATHTTPPFLHRFLLTAGKF